jgi:hypothetical protein
MSSTPQFVIVKITQLVVILIIKAEREITICSLLGSLILFRKKIIPSVLPSLQCDKSRYPSSFWCPSFCSIRVQLERTRRLSNRAARPQKAMPQVEYPVAVPHELRVAARLVIQVRNPARFPAGSQVFRLVLFLAAVQVLLPVQCPVQFPVFHLV